MLRLGKKKRSLDDVVKEGRISFKFDSNGFYINTGKVEIRYTYASCFSENSVDIKSKEGDLRLYCHAREPISSEKCYLETIEENGTSYYRKRPVSFDPKEIVFLAEKKRVEKAERMARKILDEVYFNEIFKRWVEEFNPKFPIKRRYKIEEEESTILVKTPKDDVLDRHLSAAF